MWGIVAITQNGLQLACKLNEVFPDSEVYTLPKWDKPGLKLIEGDLQSFVATLFERHRVLVFVMATGIVVRSIAPHLKSKTSDPAVLVMDEKGRYVISLLSGHLGGANAVAQQIALKTGAEAVITTSSDVNGLMAVDIFAQNNGLIIDSMADAKNITAMLVNGHRIGQHNETCWQVPEVYSSDIEEADSIVLISNKSSVSYLKPLVKLIPQNITLGVGCRRGTSVASIIAFINNELKKNNIDERSLCRIASIDVKKDEEGLIQTAQHFGVELVFFSASELAKVEEQFLSSDFVKQQVGVGAVCEPAAYLACNGNGEFILRKQSHEGITLAIFEEAKR
ncbi:MAG: cobalt-precorrin 5A hydrolase [Bacteroidota bacterium]|nr:cobalt-precorrin 5A hydrolase [Bacteroidota bacterium]